MSELEPPRYPRLYLVRHGETEWNAQGKLLSRTDEPLNDAGVRQASGLAQHLAHIRWTAVFSSPMVRARRTTELLLAGSRFPGEIVVDEKLVEMDFGPYEGWTDAQLLADEVAVARRRDGADIPGVESSASVEARARSFMEQVSSLGGSILVVGHGRMLRILIATVVLGVPAGVAHAMRLRNCQPAIVEPGARPLLLGLNLYPGEAS
jgi:broad specificity phosphatase PhoE